MSYIFKYNSKTKEPFRFDYDTRELNCIICNKIYEFYNDPFILIIDTNSFIEITYEICLTCLKIFKNCMHCNKEFNEPWNKIYFNIVNNTFYCECCYVNVLDTRMLKNIKGIKCNLPSCITCKSFKV